MNSELTTTCPFCGQKLLTMAGAIVQDDETDPRRGAVIGLKLACECEAAMRADEESNAAAEALRRQKKAKEKEARLRARFEASNLPENWHNRGLSSWQQRTPNEQAAYQAAVTFGRRFRSGERPSLYIAGPIGTGKTMLASCLSVELIRLGIPVLWSNVGEVLRSIRATFGSAEKEADAIARYTEPPVLVLDDLGKERPTEWASEQLFYILNLRYELRRSTIITTNYGGADLVRRLTPRADASGAADDTTARAIVDRLRETANLIILEGESKR